MYWPVNIYFLSFDQLFWLIECCFIFVQVLLATGGGHLVYLEIGDGRLIESKHEKLEYDISCLDINPIGDNPNYSHLAAVGMWTDISVRMYSLPELNLIRTEQLGGEIIPRSVLLCSFEGVSSFLSLVNIVVLYCRISNEVSEEKFQHQENIFPCSYRVAKQWKVGKMFSSLHFTPY